MKWKHNNPLVKKRFRTQQSEKEAMLTVFWYMKGFITIDFFEKIATANNAAYYKAL